MLGNLLIQTLDAEKAYRNTAASIIAKLVDDLPKNAEVAKNIVENFDQNKFDQVLAFAKSVNNGKID